MALVALVVGGAIAALVGGCGDDDGPAATAASTPAGDDASGRGSRPTGRSASSTAPARRTTTTAPARQATTTTTTVDEHGADPAGQLGAEDICRLLPADEVATALRVGGVTASASASATPQCSYRFAKADGVPTDATVAVLRPDEDLGGRTGEDAYAWVVELNRAAAQGAVTETPLAVGDDAIVLTGRTLHLAVFRFDDRIVTLLLQVDAGDVASVTRLAEEVAASGLAG